MKCIVKEYFLFKQNIMMTFIGNVFMGRYVFVYNVHVLFFHQLGICYAENLVIICYLCKKAGELDLPMSSDKKVLKLA